jgi:4-hydroxyproline epimerase
MLTSGRVADYPEQLRRDYDDFRRAMILEPRGSDVLVGALLCEPASDDCATAVVFFNNVGYLGMCGHGTIGLMVTLMHLGRIDAGRHRVETPVGIVETTVHDAARVTVRNVSSYRWKHAVPLCLDDGRRVTGDIAWGGNWFFLVSDHGETLAASNTARLSETAWKIRHALQRQEITGAGGAEIDHIELVASTQSSTADSRNSVLCPGGAYDRSPCGTGTSAKLACLAAEGRLAPGAIWRQESITGSIFEAFYEVDGDRILPHITGSAYICAETTLILPDADPFRLGIGT